MDVAITQLSTAFPLTTPEWAAWSANMRPPQLQGQWALSGYQSGKGAIFGQVTIARQGGADSSEFTTEITYTVASTGEHLKRTGKAIVYTGFQWRGRNTTTSGEERERELREVMFVDRDWRHASGRWFTGAYDEFGMDVQLQRVGGDPVLTRRRSDDAQSRRQRPAIVAVRRESPGARRCCGFNFGPGITVDRIVCGGPRTARCGCFRCEGRDGRPPVGVSQRRDGRCTIAVAGDIDYIKVTPEAGLARVGGANFPKQFQQFEAIALRQRPGRQARHEGRHRARSGERDLGNRGVHGDVRGRRQGVRRDDRPEVGAVHAEPRWPESKAQAQLEQLRRRVGGRVVRGAAAVNDDNTLRNSVNVGNEADAEGSRALLVTVPLYIKFDQPEVGR